MTAVSRKQVLNLLECLFNKKVKFQTDSHKYLNSFVLSLCVDRNKGKNTGVQLLLHPFVAHDLFRQNLLFKKQFKEDFDKLARNYSQSVTKKNYKSNSVYQIFFNFIRGISLKSGIYIKNIVLMRHMRRRDYQQKHMDFFAEALKLFEKNFKVIVGIDFKGVKLEITPEILEMLFLRCTNQYVDQVEFKVVDVEILKKRNPLKKPLPHKTNKFFLRNLVLCVVFSHKFLKNNFVIKSFLKVFFATTKH